MGTNAKVICTKSKIEDIADAVRLRNNTQSTYTLDGLATAVTGLNNKYMVTFTGATPNGTITATKNGVSYSTTSDSNGSGSIIVYDYGTWVITDVTAAKTRTITFSQTDAVTFSNIPGTYQEVEYIENPSDAYIMTDISSSATIGIDLEFAFSSVSANGALFGGRTTQLTNTYTCFFLTAQNGYLRFDYNGQKTITNNNTLPLNNTNVYRIYHDHTIGTITVTNEDTHAALSTSIGAASTFTDYKIALCAVNTAGTVGTHCLMKLYSCKIYTNGEIVANLIPCYRKSDNEVGVYDTVTGVFLTSPNGTNFIAGPDIL